MACFYVVELQSGDTGAVVPMAYTNQPDAEVRYHTVLQAAVKSAVRVHGALLMDENGETIKKEFYYHNPQAD